MWWGSGQDPGGSAGEGPSKEPPQNQQLLDLQEQFESQQTLIAQLKEMLKKTEHSSSVSREKVEEYASTLNKMNERAKRSKLRKAEGAKTEDETSVKHEVSKDSISKKSTSVNPAKEKVNLLRQQLEENRLKLAQRDKNQKGIEEMVNQLKAQLDDSQIMISQTTINLPKVESKPVVPVTVNYTAEVPKEELISILQNRDKQLEELNNRVQQLQGNVLDLQENVKEKDSVIDARTKAITLLSENLSKKGKNTLDMLDETKEQMRSMQEQFVAMESKMKEDNTNLRLELQNKSQEIEDLKQVNCALSSERDVLQTSNANIHDKLAALTIEFNNCQTELMSSENKVQELAKVNQDLENSMSELRTKTDLDSNVEKSERSASSSPQRTGKQKSKNWKKSKQKTVPEPSAETEHLNRIAELEKLVEELKLEQDKLQSKAKDSGDGDEVENLKKQLETMNKNMIKTKAQYKSKLKELQKKATPGEINEKILVLESENVRLEQRVAELEEEKGNLQLRLVDFDNNKDKERIADLENKIEEQKMEIENHIRIITILETQLTDKSTEISSLRTELANLMHIENAQVCSEITSVQLEEQLDKEVCQKKELEDRFDAMRKENEDLLEKIEELNKEKQEMNTKLVNYMQENMELIDRLEKSSAEKVSSAESIEIVESLTQQEKLEIEAYQKSLEFVPDKENIEPSDLDPNSDLNESVSKLTEDSSELLERIELFTVERREVMEKMDSLLSEKEHLLGKIDRLEHEKTQLLHKFDTLCTEKEQLVQDVESLTHNNEKVDVTDGIRMDSSSNNALVEEYQVLIENQKLEITELKEALLKITEENNQMSLGRDNIVRLSKEKEGLEVIISSLNEQFLTLHLEYDSFLKEHEKLKDALKRNSERVHEKEDIEKEYTVMKQQLAAFEKKVTENVEEINVLQALVQDNKNELIKSADYITSLTNELSVKHSELTTYQTEIDHLQSVVLQMNNEIEHKDATCESHLETIDLLSVQLQELKTVMNDNFRELQKYEELNNRIEETEQLLHLKDSELVQLRREKSTSDDRISSLEEEFKHACQQLKDKCTALESKIQANSGSLDDMKGPFEAKISHLEAECKKLESKNKEHVDKMKKIAANLKKKAGACQELESKLAEIKEKWENECKEKGEKQNRIEEQDKQLNENKDKINSLLEQLREMESELYNLQVRFDDKNSEYGQLKLDYEHQMQLFENEKIKLRNEVSEYMTFNDTLQSKNMSFENEIEKLHAQIGILKIESQTNKNDSTVQNLVQQIEDLQHNFATTRNAMEAKIQEKDMYIENLETDNVTLRDKLARLNEGLLQIEERRQSLETKALELGAELEAKASACEEVSLSENYLENRLAALITHDEIIGNKLKEINVTNQTLNDKIDDLSEHNLLLQGKLSETEIKLKEKENECEKMFHLESDSVQLREVISSLEHEIKKSHLDYEKKLFEKSSDIENMEQELNNQIEEINDQRKILVNRCEMLEEKLQELTDNEHIMNDEIDHLKRKLSDAKTDLEKQLNENKKLLELNSNHLLTIEQLKAQLSQIPPVENDMQSMHSEITRLQKVLAEKDNDIQNYQRQNMQLQMSMNNAPSPFDFPTDTTSKTDMLDEAALQKQLHELTNELKVSEEKLFELEKTNASLQLQLDEHKKNYRAAQEELTLQKELLIRKTAEHHVDEIINTASQTVLDNEPSNTAPVQEDIVEQVVIRESQSSVSLPPKEATEEEELLKKIKALEFMLYSVEKEKDDAVSQCHSLSNELTRLIYEREGLMGDKTKQRGEREEVDLGKLEAEILSANETVDNEHTKRDLNVVEFAPVHIKPPKFVSFDSSEMQLITEETIQAKSAYLCYSDDKELPKSPDKTGEAFGWGIEDDVLRESLETQIIPDINTPSTSAERQELQHLEFEPVHMTVSQSSHKAPIEEKIADPKLAYLCYPDDTTSIDVRDAFAGEEDGWGWNPEEVKLEAKHQQTLSAALPTQKPVDKLQDKINELENEKARLVNDIKAQQLKAAKLVKKLKDMKVKNDSLTTQLQQKSMGDFDVLDMAIQDELNTQITTLETQLKETKEEKTKDKAERDHLLKRIDILTAANERMVEIKEKQDTEIQTLHFNNRQLSSKLEQLEWGDDSPRKVAADEYKDVSTSQTPGQNKDLVKKIEELCATVNDLTIDNEEMQLLLEEQRKLRLAAEKALASVPIQDNMKTEQEYLALKDEKDEINKQLVQLTNENKYINEKLVDYIKISDNLCPVLDSVQEKIKILSQEKRDMSNRYTVSLEELQKENDKLHEQLNSTVLEEQQIKRVLQSEMDQLRDKLSALAKDNSALELVVSEKQNVIVELNSSIDKLKADKNNLEIKLREISGVLCSENADQLEGLGEKLEIIVKEIQDKNKEVSELNNVLNVERVEFEQKLAATLDQLAQEWALRVEQRGNDVAESWKLHVESRESEFAQTEQALRLELTEICTKNEAVIAENNELQKKVELLLQEKQAAASDNKTEALQQILTERQSEIISLSQQLQDVSVQLEVKNNEIISLQQIIDSMQKTNNELIEKNEELRTCSKHFEQLNMQLDNENKDLKKLSKQNEELNTQLQIENQEIEIFKQTVEGLKQELTKVRDELFKERTKCVDSENQVIQLQESIQISEMKLQEIINAVEDTDLTSLDSSFDRVACLQQWITQINQKQQLLLQDKEQCALEKTTLEQSNNQLSSSVSHYQQLNEELTAELAALREASRNLEADLSDRAHSRNTEINTMSAQINDLEFKHQEEMTVKNNEIKNLQKELFDHQTKEESNLANIQIQLQSKLAEIFELESKVNELNTLSSEESKQMDELRNLLSRQTSEMEELKLNLVKKNDDYNTVVEELENITQIYQKHLITPVHEKRVHFKEPLSESKSLSYQEQEPSAPSRKISIDSDDSEPINRAELDLALYMLHQRDVRCEELTVELMQLLEERDTLQLRLSNAIRINEELRGKMNPQKADTRGSEELNTPKVVQSTGAIPKSKSSDIVLKAMGTELATEAIENPDKHKTSEKQELDNKLSQLRSVGYRDKTLQDDQEIRYLQQMSIMQQHRDLASRLPAEAAAKLVDASYTLSRDVQSPSKVLLNWLWGKSTPKVNDV